MSSVEAKVKVLDQSITEAEVWARGLAAHQRARARGGVTPEERRKSEMVKTPLPSKPGGMFHSNSRALQRWKQVSSGRGMSFMVWQLMVPRRSTTCQTAPTSLRTQSHPFFRSFNISFSTGLPGGFGVEAYRSRDTFGDAPSLPRGRKRD